MEGGQKTKIALDSPLDINSQDMLVPAGNAKFSFNRQRYLGSLLQTSVRYEADGWFAGWWGHNFDFISTGNNSITPPLGDPSQLIITNRKSSDGASYYNLQQKDAGVSIAFTTAGWSKWQSGSGSVVRTSDSVVTITGSTSGGMTFTATVNAYTGALLSFNGSDPALNAKSSKDGDSYRLEVQYGLGADDNYITLRKNGVLTVAGVKLDYSRDASKSDFGGVFTLTDANMLSVNSAYNNTFTLISQSPQQVGTLNEYVEASIKMSIDATLDIEFSGTEKWVQGRFDEATFAPGDGTIGKSGQNPAEVIKDENGIHVIRAYNVQDMINVERDPTEGYTDDTYVVYAQGVPIWMYFGSDWNIELDFKNENQSITCKLLLSSTKELIANIQDIITDNSIIQSDWRFRFNDDETWHSMTELDYTITEFEVPAPTYPISWPNPSPPPDFIEEEVPDPPPYDPEGEDVMFIQSAMPPVPFEYTGTMYLQCFNKNPDYPLEVDEEYFGLVICSFHCKFTYHWEYGYSRDDDAEEYVYDESLGEWKLDEDPILVWLALPPVYSTLFQQNNYKSSITFSLNLLANPKLIEYLDIEPNVKLGVNIHAIPQCAHGYSVIKVQAVDLYLGNKEAFEVTTVKNSAYNLKLWRIDDGGGEGDGNWTLGEVMPEFVGVANYSTTEKVVGVALKSARKNFYYQLKNNEFVYPKFIDGTGLGDMDAYELNKDMNNQAFMALDITIGYFMLNMSFKGKTVNTDAFSVKFQNSLSQASFLIERDGTEQTITIYVDVDKTIYIELTWDAIIKTFTVKDSSHMIPYIFKGWADKYQQNKYFGTLSFAIEEELAIQFYRTFVYAKNGMMVPASIVNQKGSKVTLTSGYGTVDLDTGSLSGATAVQFASSNTGSNFVQIFVGVSNSAIVVFLPHGIFSRSSAGIVYISSGGNSLVFEYNGQRYTVNIDPSGETALYYSVTDIRNGEYKEVYKRDISDVYMYIKQFWASTVDIENYWWLDNNHVLELSKYYMTLYVKVAGKVHDWMGDQWEIKQRVYRNKIVGTDDLYYAVTSAYNGLPVLFKLQAELNSTELTIKYVIASGSMNLNSLTWTTATVPIKKLELGDAPDSSAISSYVGLNAASLVGAAKISSTCVSGVFLLGLALNSGLQQWTLKISGGSASVVTGYGYVGIDGALTGGEIPDACCDATGFKEPVLALSELPETLESFNNLPEGCYGTGTQVWFVYRNKITSIVSHMTFSGGSFSKVPLYLNNNLVTRYESESFAVARMFDFLPQTYGINDLFPDTGSLAEVLDLMSAIAFPSLWVLNLVYASFNFINHSTGQYAYVWRNALQGEVGKPRAADNADEPKAVEINQVSASTAETIFGKVEHSVTWKDEHNTASKWLDIVLKGLTGAIGEVSKYVANESQNQTSPEETGPKFAAFAVDNVATTVATAILTGGVTNSMSSTIKEMMSLNMFYSISDKTQCFAGPGYVNHNLTGQCIAQSVTDTQADGKKYGYFVVFKKLSLAIAGFQLKTARWAYEALGTTANDIKDIVIWVTVLGSGTAVPVGQIGAAILRVTQLLAQGLIIAYELAIEYVIPAFADALGSEIGQAFSAGIATNRKLELEGQHSYGDKPMSFFWPAFGVNSPLTYTDEKIYVGYKETNQELNLAGKYTSQYVILKKDMMTLESNQAFAGDTSFSVDLTVGAPGPLNNKLYSVYITPSGKDPDSGEGATIRTAPDRMAVVEGIESFLPPAPFKNQSIGMPWPTFLPPAIHDYEVNKQWNIGFMATSGMVVWVSQDDTKLIDGPPSNIVINGSSFCGIACPYTAIEVKPEFDARYLRPFAVTPDAIALNINRVNCVHDAKAYHAFDGQGNRIINWRGGAGMDKSYRYLQYNYQINDHFKRSNIIPPSEFYGDFNGPPTIAIKSYERVANVIEAMGLGIGFGNPAVGEDKDARRYSLPVHSENISTLPAMVRMLGPYKLAVIDGITSLVTDLRNAQSAYKAPSSTDFNIDGEPYRATAEYINSMIIKSGIVAMETLVAIAGLTFVGATTKEAFFYSAATRLYYKFGGGRDITKVDVLNRFHDLREGRWDFVNQEVAFKCLLGDNVIVCRLDGGTILGEVWPPLKTIYSKTSDFKLLSMAGGLLYQGPKRFIVNRFIINEHMFSDIIANKRKWKRVSRDNYDTERGYGWEYVDFDTVTPGSAVRGWTHNPFELVTAMLGGTEEDDGKFEWSLTFAWTEQMDVLFEKDEYTVVNVQAETITQGGTKLSEVTHIFLFKEMFTRQGCAGYYTFQFQSNNGTGNRERLILWGDGINALESIALDTKVLSSRRTQILNTQLDVQDLVEL